MKVSISPKVAMSGSDAETGLAPKNAADQDASTPDIDRYFSDPKAAGDDAGEETVETDPFLEHLAFFGAGDIGESADFADVYVPSVEDILADLDTTTTPLTDQLKFFEELEGKYSSLKDRVAASINHLRDIIGQDPSRAQTYNEVIEKRLETLRKIDEEVAKLEPLKESVSKVYEQELANLKEYGKEYYKWSVAYAQHQDYTYKKVDGSTVTEKASLANKPDPMDTRWSLNLNGDAYIGNPEDSKLAIAKKDVLIDGETKKIYDVVDTSAKKPVSFSATGEITGLGSSKNADYNWTISHGNLNLVDPANWGSFIKPSDTDSTDVVMQLASTDNVHAGNGYYDAPIDITIPEYVRVDKKDKPIGIVQDGASVSQGKVTGTDGWTLKRVVKVEVGKRRSLHSDGSFVDDYVIELYDDKGDKIMTMRIVAPDTASTKYAISLNAGYANDEYKRTSGINIDAARMPAKAQFTLTTNVIDKIEQDYGIPGNPENSSRYNEAIRKLAVGPAGLMVSGFNNVAGTFTGGNDIICIEEHSADLAEYKAAANAENADDPLNTDALDGRGGFNAVFQKNGNLYADQFSLVWAGEGEGDKYINVPLNAAVYVNLKNTDGTVEIGNHYETFGPDHDQWGLDDDAYSIASSDVKFYSWYENELQQYRQEQGLSEPPATHPDGTDNMQADPTAYSGVLADPADIANRVKMQIDEQLKALKARLEDDTAGSLDYSSGVDLPPTAAEMQAEVDTFFSEWNGYFDPGNLDIDADTE